MKWCRIELEHGPAYGIVEGAQVVVLSAAPFERLERTGARYPLESVKLLPPVVPPNFYAAGINFAPHIEWANEYLGMSLKVPPQADIGYRSANALVGSGADIVIPKDSPGPIEFEGELVAVVGKKAKRVSEDEALGCIAGYTLGNDLSERSFQQQRPHPVARQEHRHLQADGAGGGLGHRSRAKQDDRRSSVNGKPPLPVQHQGHDLQPAALHCPHEQLCDPVPGRRHLARLRRPDGARPDTRRPRGGANDAIGVLSNRVGREK